VRQKPSKPNLVARVAEAVARRPWPVAAVLILLFGALSWSAVREKSVTFDEIAHVTAGYSYWIYGDYRLHPENGILPQRLATLPLLAMSFEFPDRDNTDWHDSNVWNIGYAFFYELGNNSVRMLWLASGMIVLLGMALASVVFVWSRRLFGVGGGLLSLALFAFCPTLLAHSALATSDVAVSLMFLVALGCFWTALHEVSVPRTLVSGLALGLLLVSKMSAVVILPVLAILFLLRAVVGRPLLWKWRGKSATILLPNRQVAALFGSLFIQALLASGVIWLFYGFQFAIFREFEPARDHMFGDYTLRSLTAEGLLGFFIRLANDWHVLPEPYLYGFAFTVHASLVRVSFLNGEFGYEGFRSFFPTAFLVKTPLPTLAIIAAAALVPAIGFLGASNRRASRNRRWRHLRRGLYRTAPLWLFLIVYGAIALRSNLNIGHRHILPMYPAIFVLCGAAAYWFRNRHAIVRAAPWIAVAILAVQSLAIYPHYLAYFNELAGGPRNGYRILVDSSLDWGQDLPALKRWIDRHAAPKQTIYLSYFGVGLPKQYGLTTLELPAYPDWRKAPETGDLLPGIYAISATNLQHVYLSPRGPWTVENENRYQELLIQIAALNRRPQEAPQEAAERTTLIREFERYRFGRLCAYLRLREPVDNAGYSILIYDVSADDLNRALFRPLSEWTAPPPRSN
jgi:4-amino-4-deoxy-L-arabinose transferase-like glycosyltransferase